VFRMDMHVHTEFSPDAFLSLKTIVKVCKAKGINCLAVTDHDTIKGARQLQKMTSSLRVIIGEEIESTEGEIIGLFLKAEISPHLSPEATISEIRKQGGIVYIPHPFATSRKLIFRKARLAELTGEIDILEVFNSRSLCRASNGRALEFALSKNLLCGAGSDAHSRLELGNAYVELKKFETKDDFLENLKKAKICGQRTSLLIRVIMNRMVRKGLRRFSKSLRST